MLDLGKFPKFAQDTKLMKRIAFLEVEWRRAYPLVDLDKQASWAHVWLITSGKKYHDMARFLSNWFKRCQQDLEISGASTGPIRMPDTTLAKQMAMERDFKEDMTVEEMISIRKANMNKTENKSGSGI